MTPPQPSVWIQELTWEEIRDYLTRHDVALVPIGSTEQHGPAGTLGVDTYVAIGLTEDVARRAGAFVASPLWYGESSHHMSLAEHVGRGAVRLSRFTTEAEVDRAGPLLVAAARSHASAV